MQVGELEQYVCLQPYSPEAPLNILFALMFVMCYICTYLNFGQIMTQPTSTLSNKFSRAPRLAELRQRLRDQQASPLLANSPAMKEINTVKNYRR